jgi:hypothetical protein
MYQCEGTLRLASHSLGAQVLFSALRALDSNYTDFNATAQVGDNHSGYLAATTDEAVYHMNHISQYD